MRSYYSSLEKNELWDLEMEILSYYQNLIKEKQVISKSSCYYPRLANTNKRGRIAFIELYRSVCCDDKKKLSIEDFELFICKNKNWSVLSQPTDKGGEMSTEYILECEIGSFEDYLNKFEYLMTPTIPSITINEEKSDNLSAIKNLANNLEITKKDYMELIKYFLGELEPLL